jgi:hypothetical protein
MTPVNTTTARLKLALPSVSAHRRLATDHRAEKMSRRFC